MPHRPAALAFAAALIWSSGSTDAIAQGNDARAATVEFRVTRFDPGDAPPPKFLAGDDRRAVEFEVPMTHIAGPFQAGLRDGVFLDLRREGSQTPDHSIRIEPAEAKHLLLVFFPQENGFRITKVQTQPERIKGGARMIVNITPNEMAIKMGDLKPLLIPPAGSGILEGPPGDEIVSLPVLINLKKDDQWELASTEQWPYDPRFRRFLFAYICPHNRHLMFHGVSEMLE
jgi:hypothetical protein